MTVKLSHKIKVVLEHLFNGDLIKYKDYEIGMSENYDIGIVFRNEKNEVLIGGCSMWSVGEFIRWVDKMSEEDYNNLVLNKVLKSFYKER